MSINIKPHRVLLNKDHEARPPTTISKWDIIFIRKDGWMLAATNELEAVAYSLWPDEWFAFQRPTPGDTRILPIEVYREQKNETQCSTHPESGKS